MDRYRTNRVVGQGSFGRAVLCARRIDEKPCIIKQVDTSKLSSRGRRAASKEAALLAKLSHPNIIGFWESFFHGRSRRVLCIVMDYADGGDLSSCLSRQNGRLVDEEVVLDWFVQTTLALKHIHDRKILHRDLKTQNIFLTRSRVVKLGDFGIAKVLESTLDLAHTAIGTPYYMSPEICREKQYNHKTDMWSLGCVLYEMVCLRHPFEGRDMRMLVMKICTQNPRPVSSRYSSGVRNLVAQLLKKDPSKRPSTGAVLRRPLLKDKIGRFLSEAQIQEEFDNGASPHGAGNSAAAPAGPPSFLTGAAAAAVAAAAAAPAPAAAAVAGSVAPLRWPFSAVAGTDPPGMNANFQGADAVVVGRAVGEGGGVKVARSDSPESSAAAAVAKENEARERAAALVEAEKEKKKSDARAAAKERGHRAAIALRVAKSSSNRPPPTPGFEEGKADHCRRGQAQNADKEQNRPSPPLSADARRRRQKAQERANAARLVLGIGKRAPPTPPRKASHRDIGGGRGEAAARGGVSTPSSSPMGGADAKIRDRTRSDGSIPALSGVKNSGPGKEKKVSSPPFCSPAVQDVPPPPPSENGQHILRRAQSARCGGTDDESRRLVERVVAAPGGSSLERRRWASGGEDKAGGVKVADSDPMGTAGPDLARRRQAANAVFGLGFKSDREGIVSSVRAEEKEVALENAASAKPPSLSSESEDSKDSYNHSGSDPVGRSIAPSVQPDMQEALPPPPPPVVKPSMNPPLLDDEDSAVKVEGQEALSDAQEATTTGQSPAVLGNKKEQGEDIRQGIGDEVAYGVDNAHHAANAESSSAGVDQEGAGSIPAWTEKKQIRDDDAVRDVDVGCAESESVDRISDAWVLVNDRNVSDGVESDDALVSRPDDNFRSEEGQKQLQQQQHQEQEEDEVQKEQEHGEGKEGITTAGSFSGVPSELEEESNFARDAGDSIDAAAAAPLEFNVGVDVVYEDDWFQKLEAKMGAVKEQVSHFRSPAYVTPRRNKHDQLEEPDTRHDPAAVLASEGKYETPPPMATQREHDENNGERPRETVAKQLVDSGAACHDFDVDRDDCRDDRVLDPISGTVLPRSQDAPSCRPEARGGKDGQDVIGRVCSDDELSAVEEATSDDSASMAMVPATDDRSVTHGVSPLEARCVAYQRQPLRLSAVAAAVETAAAVVAAIPATVAEKKSSNESIRRAVSSPLGRGVKVKVVTTPAQRRSGGGGKRGARRPLTPSQSERKPARRDAAIEGEVERHSENRPPKQVGQGRRRSSGDEAAGCNGRTPSTEERVQTLRAARDGERAKLRALISRKRKAALAAAHGQNRHSSAASPTALGAGDTPTCDTQSSPEVAWREAASGRVGESPVPSTPRDKQVNRAKVIASAPPHVRRIQSPSRGAACPYKRAPVVGRGGLVMGGRVELGRRFDAGGGSAGTPHRGRRRPRSNDDETRDGLLPSEKSRNPARRQHDLRAFIAKSRRERRTNRTKPPAAHVVKKSVDNHDGDDPAVAGTSRTPTDREETDADSAGASVASHGGRVKSGPRRNIGLEFGDESVCGFASEQQGGERQGDEDRALAGLRIGKDLTKEKGEKPHGVDERDINSDGSVDATVDASHRYQTFANGNLLRRNVYNEAQSALNGDKDHAAGNATQGRDESSADHAKNDPGLATYELQRAASAGSVMDGGGGRPGTEEYARMLKRMQQEVMDLNDGSSSDSSWGTSSTGEAAGGDDDDDDSEESQGQRHDQSESEDVGEHLMATHGSGISSNSSSSSGVVGRNVEGTSGMRMGREAEVKSDQQAGSGLFVKEIRAEGGRVHNNGLAETQSAALAQSRMPDEKGRHVHLEEGRDGAGTGTGVPGDCRRGEIIGDEGSVRTRGPVLGGSIIRTDSHTEAACEDEGSISATDQGMEVADALRERSSSLSPRGDSFLPGGSLEYSGSRFTGRTAGKTWCLTVQSNESKANGGDCAVKPRVRPTGAGDDETEPNGSPALFTTPVREDPKRESNEMNRDSAGGIGSGEALTGASSERPSHSTDGADIEPAAADDGSCVASAVPAPATSTAVQKARDEVEKCMSSGARQGGSEGGGEESIASDRTGRAAVAVAEEEKCTPLVSDDLVVPSLPDIAGPSDASNVGAQIGTKIGTKI